MAGLVTMLTANVTSTADGGGKVSAAGRIVAGRERVARYLAGAFSRPVAGEPAVLGFVGEALAGVLFFEVDHDRIAALRIVANPDKLRFLATQLSHPVGLPGS